MANTSLIQVRIDEELKKTVSDIYEKLGIDIPTAIRIFLKKSEMVRGIPFEMTLSEDIAIKAEAKKAFEEMRKQAADLPEMTSEEIDEEIRAARAERKVNK